MDELEIQVEVFEKVFSDEIRKMENLNRQLTMELDSALGIRVKGTLKESEILPRSEGKAQL